MTRYYSNTHWLHWFIGVQFMRLFISHYSLGQCAFHWNPHYRLSGITSDCVLAHAYNPISCGWIWQMRIMNSQQKYASISHISRNDASTSARMHLFIRCCSCSAHATWYWPKYGTNVQPQCNRNGKLLMHPPKRHLLKNFVYFMHDAINSVMVTLYILFHAPRLFPEWQIKVPTDAESMSICVFVCNTHCVCVGETTVALFG